MPIFLSLTTNNKTEERLATSDLTIMVPGQNLFRFFPKASARIAEPRSTHVTYLLTEKGSLQFDSVISLLSQQLLNVCHYC